MATKNKPQVFKSFEEIDVSKCRIEGNIEIIGTVPPIIEEPKQGKSNMATTKKKAAPAAEETKASEEVKPQETKNEQEQKPVETKIEEKETKPETKNNTKEEGKDKMKEETKTVETKATETKPETATPATSIDMKEIEKLMKNVGDGKIKIEVEHKQNSPKDEFLRGLAWGGGFAIGFTVITVGASLLFGGGESSAE